MGKNIRKRIEVYVTPEKHKELKIFCANLCVSMSWFIDKAISDRVKKEIAKLKKG